MSDLDYSSSSDSLDNLDDNFEVPNIIKVEIMLDEPIKLAKLTPALKTSRTTELTAEHSNC